MRTGDRMIWFDRILWRWRHKFVYPYLSKDKTLCDVGCAEGDFILRIANRVKQAYGYDKGDECDTKFDIVTAFAVIEHIPVDKVLTFVCELNDRRKKDGIILITTPSVMAKPVLEFFVSIGLMDYDSVYDHKHYYTKDELTDLFSRVGCVTHKYFQAGLNQLVIVE